MVADEPVGHVLIVEDDEATSRIISTAFEEVSPWLRTHVVRDIDQCLAILRSDDESDPYPDLVLLDLSLSNSGGLEFLDTRMDDPTLRKVPTVVLSGMNDQETINECYERGANTFISKPGDLDGFINVAERVVEYWFVTAELVDEPAIA